MSESTLFAQRLKQARTDKKMKQSELSEISGVSIATISAYESADGTKGKNPSLENARSLAKALGISLDWLCGMPDNISEKPATYSELFKFLVYISNSAYTLVYSADRSNEYGELLVGIIEFRDTNIYNFISKWEKIKRLYDQGDIDRELYSLWLEKQYKDYNYEIAKWHEIRDGDLPF